MKNIISPTLKLPNFRKLYFAGATSELGSFVTETVLMLFVFKLTNQDKSYLGILRATFLVFLTLGGILGGPIGNAFNRKKVLIFCEIGRIPLLICLLFFQNVGIVIACDAVIAFFTGIFRPSRQALLNEIVPQDKIKKANGFFASTNAVLHLVGPLLGASLFGFFQGINEVLILDLATYGLGLFLLSRISYAPSKDSFSGGESFLSEISSGFGYLRKRKDLFAINLNALSAGFAIGILIPLLVPFTLEVLGRTERDYGILMTFFGLGGLFGSWATEKASELFPNGKIPYITIILETIVFLLFINNRSFIIATVILFFWGLLVFLRITSQMNFISDSVETKYLTRVHAMLEMSFIVPNISGGLLIALLGNDFKTVQLLQGASLLFLLFIIPRMPFPHMRALWSVRPEGVTREIQID